VVNILVIPEDFRNDQYILKPIFSKLFNDLGKSKAKVVVCNPPLLGGVVEALKSERLKEILELYPMVDIFILCVDRDGVAGRKNRLIEIEAEFGGKKVFFAENAWEELETWALAGVDLPKNWSWADIRADVSVKENYFTRLAKEMGVADGPGRGRKAIGEAASRRIDAIMAKCPEDFGNLAGRIQSVVT
jgi:hypothetical protein